MNNQYADENRPVNKILQSTVRDVECGWKQEIYSKAINNVYL